MISDKALFELIRKAAIKIYTDSNEPDKLKIWENAKPRKLSDNE
jgi:hypothetical protein